MREVGLGRRVSRGFGLIIVVALAVALAAAVMPYLARTASAHASLISASPGNNETLQAAADSRDAALQ